MFLHRAASRFLRQMVSPVDTTMMLPSVNAANDKATCGKCSMLRMGRVLCKRQTSDLILRAFEADAKTAYATD